MSNPKDMGSEEMFQVLTGLSMKTAKSQITAFNSEMSEVIIDLYDRLKHRLGTEIAADIARNYAKVMFESQWGKGTTTIKVGLDDDLSQAIELLRGVQGDD